MTVLLTATETTEVTEIADAGGTVNVDETAAPVRLSQAETSAMIERNLPLVQHVLYQVAAHYPRHADREELAQAATLGLVEARSEEHTSELQSRTVISYAVFCLKKKKHTNHPLVKRGRNISTQKYEVVLFFFNDTATTEIYTTVHTLSLHDALPTSSSRRCSSGSSTRSPGCSIARPPTATCSRSEEHTSELQSRTVISYAVFCLKKKKPDAVGNDYDSTQDREHVR